MERSRVQLPVRVRRTVRSDGRVSTMMSIDCPLRGHAVPFATCRDCHDCCFVGINERRGGIEVVCAPPGAEPPRRQASARDHMTTNVLCVSPDVPLARLRELFLTRSIDCLPVVDEGGRVLGLVTRRDVL